MTYEEMDALQDAAQPLMKYLRDNHHPHRTVTVTSERAELVEGVAAVMRKRNPTVKGSIRQQCSECDCDILKSLAPDCPGVAECAQCGHPNDVVFHACEVPGTRFSMTFAEVDAAIARDRATAHKLAINVAKKGGGAYVRRLLNILSTRDILSDTDYTKATRTQVIEKLPQEPLGVFVSCLKLWLDKPWTASERLAPREAIQYVKLRQR